MKNWGDWARGRGPAQGWGRGSGLEQQESLLGNFPSQTRKLASFILLLDQEVP